MLRKSLIILFCLDDIDEENFLFATCLKYKI